jgi:hypothetical protein
MKSKDLKRRIQLIDAWFDVVGSECETNSISIVPTISIQSISDEAMNVAKRSDLSYENKIKLSQHINKRCQEEGFPIPAIELIMGMPGSTLDDFYAEWEIMWNFKAWTSFRHDYMFLPDTDLTDKEYLDKYEIKLVEVYSDLVDEFGVDNHNSLYKNKKTNFKTISSCYSFTNDEMCEMWLMNLAENKLLEEIYPMFQDSISPAQFGKNCYKVMRNLDVFQDIILEIKDLLNPNTQPRNIKRLKGRLRNLVINELIDLYKPIITSELYGY